MRTAAFLTSIIVLVLIPALYLSYYLFPAAPVITLGNNEYSSETFGWPVWNAFVYQVSQFLAGIIIPVVVMAIIGKKVHWMALVILAEMLLANLWFLGLSLIPGDLITDFDKSLLLTFSVLVVSIILLYHFFRKPTLEEKYNKLFQQTEDLMGKLQKLERDQLPGLMMHLINIKAAAAVLDDENWRKVQVILLEDQQEGEEAITRAIRFILDSNPQSNEKERSTRTDRDQHKGKN